MKMAHTLVESLLPVRNRMVRDDSVGTYDVSNQTRGYSTDGRLLPDEVRASDGGFDGTKISDKTVEGQLL